ncbi:hypothetical protein ABIF76_008192, partial [Bradyrhizobium ottawaense]
MQRAKEQNAVHLKQANYLMLPLVDPAC